MKPKVTSLLFIIIFVFLCKAPEGIAKFLNSSVSTFVIEVK